MHVTGRSRIDISTTSNRDRSRCTWQVVVGLELQAPVGLRVVVLREDSTERLSTFRYVYVGVKWADRANFCQNKVNLTLIDIFERTKIFFINNVSVIPLTCVRIALTQPLTKKLRHNSTIPIVTWLGLELMMIHGWKIQWNSFLSFQNYVSWKRCEQQNLWKKRA